MGNTFIILVAISLLVSCYCAVDEGSKCLTPNGAIGTCIPIDQCRSVLKIVQNVKITQEELEFVKKSHCGLEGTTPSVCCPETCVTPTSENGTCVSLYSCPSLDKLLGSPLSTEGVQYLRNSKCPGTQGDYVCCPPNDPATAAGVCAATFSTLPTDQRTECCGVESRLTNVNKGAKTNIYQYPWLVFIEYFNEKFHSTGSLISAWYVLTAGQCVTGRDVDRIGPPVSVRLGEYDATNSFEADCSVTKDGLKECNDGMIRIDIERSIPHPDYKYIRSRSNHDIALIRLKQRAPFTEFIRPICLPSADLTIASPADFTLFVAGWGASNPMETFSQFKLHVDLPFVEKERCQTLFAKEFRKYVNFTKGNICAGGVAGKDTCTGDAGAPLMYTNGITFQVIGIVSIGSKRCGQAVPGVYTNVYEYLPWITKIINIDSTVLANDYN